MRTEGCSWNVSGSLQIVVAIVQSVSTGDMPSRATASTYGELDERSEISNFLFLCVCQKDPFGELFSEIYLKGSNEFTFKILVKSRKIWNTTWLTWMADEICPKLSIFNRPIQEGRNLISHSHSLWFMLWSFPWAKYYPEVNTVCRLKNTTITI